MRSEKKRCEFCGEGFIKKSYHSKKYWASARFCSNRCKVLGGTGFYKHWSGKKRPNLKQSNSAKTMFKPGQVSWNKGKGTGRDPVKPKYNAYKSNAKKRGYLFEVALDQFRDYLSTRCAYCGDPSTGIDRVDNALGYIDGNMVPCCETCNHMKWVLSKDDFLAKCKQIVTVVGYEI